MRLLLVDGTNVVMRAAFGGDVDVERAVQVATGMIGRACLQLKPTHMIIAFDSPTSSASWRRDACPTYKANRDPGKTKPYIVAAERAWRDRNMATIWSDGFEADDVIATLVARRPPIGMDVVVLSGDSDLLVLVSGRVAIARYQQGESKLPVMYEADVRAKYAIRRVEQLPLYKALVGEPGDNIAGVPGIGPKKAVSLLMTYDTLGEMLAVAPRPLPPHVRELIAVEKHADQVRLALRLITLRTNVPLPPIPQDRAAVSERAA